MRRAYQYPVAAQVWALREHGEVGPRTFRALMAHFGNIAAILESELEELETISGLGKKRAEKINAAFAALPQAETFIESLKGKQVGCSTIFDNDYPPLFLELHDPPPVIFYRGRLPEPDEKTVAIVGSHKATGEGIGRAVELASQLAAKNVSIVSGLARGIDTAAHIGTLKAEGRTYGVIGSGFEHISPEENRALAREMEIKGGVLSEYPPDATYSTGRIVARNRLTVGLSQAVVIGEVFHDSTGTLDTATFCRDLGKLMFVLIDDYDRPGCDKGGVEEVLALGAIPISLEGGVDIILKALV